MKAKAMIAAAALGLLAGLLQPAAAQERGDQGDKGYIQLSLFPPVQLVDKSLPVEGFRLGILPVNSEMTGLDIGIVTWTSGDLTALQAGLVNVVGGEAVGVQFAWANIVSGRTVGWQSGVLNIDAGGFIGFQDGLVNITGGKVGVGVQLGALNYASEFTGVMLGLINITPKLAGIQIGFVNYAGNSAVPIFPIANAAF
jgi:hypothetical protein